MAKKKEKDENRLTTVCKTQHIKLKTGQHEPRSFLWIALMFSKWIF